MNPRVDALGYGGITECYSITVMGSRATKCIVMAIETLWATCFRLTLNSLRPNGTCIRHSAWSSLIQTMACHLFVAKLLSEPILADCSIIFTTAFIKEK